MDIHKYLIGTYSEYLLQGFATAEKQDDTKFIIQGTFVPPQKLRPLQIRQPEPEVVPTTTLDDLQEIERSFVQFMISRQDETNENHSQRDENGIPNENKNLDYTQSSQGSQKATEETLTIRQQLNPSNNLPLSEESEGLDEFDNFVEPNVTNYNPGLGTSRATTQKNFLNDSIIVYSLLDKTTN